jgi:hypothetical protein
MNISQPASPITPLPTTSGDSRPEETCQWPSCIRRSFTVIDEWLDAKLAEGLASIVKRVIRAAPIVFTLIYTQLEGPSFFVGLPIVVLLEKSELISAGYLAPLRDGIGFSLLSLAYSTFLVFLKTHEFPLFAVTGILFFFSMVSLPSERAQQEELALLPPHQNSDEASPPPPQVQQGALSSSQ